MEKQTLPNGVRIVTEHVDNVRSVAVGIWVGCGSRFENAKTSGAAHFIEHMLFKGTARRTAAELAGVMDEIGGQINAFTAKDHTCYHGRVLDEHLPLLLDVLCDMFFDAKFDGADVANERGVILEEIDMYEDAPDDLVNERLFSAVFKGSSLARNVLGTPAALAKMTGESLKRYKNTRYLGGDVIVAVSGSFKDAELDIVRDKFASLPSGKLTLPDTAVYSAASTTRRKDIEQLHMCVGYPGCVTTDDRRFAFQLLNNILGGGMSSRLFQRLREELGLCYSVFSYLSAHDDCGLFAVALALAPENRRKATAAFNDEIKRFLDNGVTDDELYRAREQVKAAILLGLESTGSRMQRIGRGELTFGYVPAIDDTIASYNAVTAAAISDIAREILTDGNRALSVVGR